MKHFQILVAAAILSVTNVVHASPQSVKQQVVNTPTKQQQLLMELTGQDDSKISDIELYAQIVSTYNEGNEIGFKSRLQNLMQRFPQSSYADNALFLAGMMAVNNANFPEAIRYFSRIQKDYPRGDKLSSATFAKAMTYKKMNLDQFAKKVLTEVKKKYPGSPEAYRAEVELKMIN